MPGAPTISAYQGHIRPLSSFPRLVAGTHAGLPIEITNQSHIPWRSEGERPTNLSYHWCTENGETLIKDGHRTALPGGELTPGQTAIASMLLQAPGTPGLHKLVVSLVQEGECWFEEKGFTPPCLFINVC